MSLLFNRNCELKRLRSEREQRVTAGVERALAAGCCTCPQHPFVTPTVGRRVLTERRPKCSSTKLSTAFCTFCTRRAKEYGHAMRAVHAKAHDRARRPVYRHCANFRAEANRCPIHKP